MSHKVLDGPQIEIVTQKPGAVRPAELMQRPLLALGIRGFAALTRPAIQF